MIYENNGQKYLLLTPQCQIEKNRQDIEAIINDAVAFNYIGMKVVGQVNTADELPKKADYEVWPFDYGDAFAVGTTDPYNYYLWTRAFGAHLSDHWFNIGIFPGPSTVPGPKGDTGETGPAPNLTIGTVTSTLSQPQVTIEGTSPNYTLNFKLQKGDKGDPGTNGRNGVDGKNGKDGTNAIIYTVKGAVDTVSQLPVATSVSTDTAYLVKDGSLLYGIMVQNGTNIWYNYGSTRVGPRGPAGVGTTDLTQVQFPEGEHTITLDDIDGLSIVGTGKFSYGTNDTATPQMTVRVPLKAGTGISMEADANSKFLEIKNADHDALAGKLDKKTGTTTYPQAYIKNTNGQQTMFSVTPSSAASTIVIRDANGNANIANPTADTHIANKAYVDTADAKKLDKKTTTGYFAYTHDGSTQGELKISQSNDASTLAQRDSAGRISAAAPTNTTHCATKGYVDEAASGKLDKDTRNSSYDQVYGKKTNGTQSMINISNSIAGNSLIIRDNDGRAYIAIPTESNHIANKYYVDNAIPHLYMHTIYNSQYGTRASNFVFTFYSIRNTKYTTTTELYNAETNLRDKWIVASGQAYSEGTTYVVNAASIRTAGILYSNTSNDDTSYSGSIQDDVVQIF